jgi:cyclase
MSSPQAVIPRLIPVLLLQQTRIVKTVRFKKPVYVGDPLNAVRIFNEKEVDELLILDIRASKEQRGPDVALIRDIASECFMPLAYGGGVRSLRHIQEVIACGVEKVAMNGVALDDPTMLSRAVKEYGGSTIVGAMDVKKDLFGRRRVFDHRKDTTTSRSPVDHARALEQCGVGEILLNSVDQDGTMAGFDLELVREIAAQIRVPLIACGGAGSLPHFGHALQAGASAVAAGSKFIYYGPHRAVLINYPTRDEIRRLTTGVA